jgi:MoxR-like ATPase
MREKIDALTQNLARTIVGKHEAIRLVIVALLGGGHALLEDVPGVGKTLLAKSLARSVDGKFQRLQCTPDLLPTDITGTNIWNPKTGEFTFLQGPVFANDNIAHKLNRDKPLPHKHLLNLLK